MRFEPNPEARWQLTVDSGNGTKIVVGLEDYEYATIKAEVSDALVVHHSKVTVADIETHISVLNAQEFAKQKSKKQRPQKQFPVQFKIKDSLGNEMIKVVSEEQYSDLVDQVADLEDIDDIEDVTDQMITDFLQVEHNEQVAKSQMPNQQTGPYTTPVHPLPYNLPPPPPPPPRPPFKCNISESSLSLAMPDGTMADIPTANYERYMNDISEREDLDYQDITVEMLVAEHQEYLQDLADSQLAKAELESDWNSAEFDDFKFNEWDSPDEINQPRVQMSDTALELDMWSRHQGEIIAAECQKIMPLMPDLDPLAIADFNAACFEPDPILCPEELVSEEVRHRYEFMQNLLEQPEFRALHEQTQLNQWASEAATASIAQEYVVLKKKEEQEQGDGDGDKPGSGKGKGPASGGGIGTGKGSGKDKVSANPMAHEIRQIRAISRAVVAAQKEVDNANDIAGAFGFSDLKDGNNNLDRKALSEVFKRCQKDRMLAKIAEFAGKYRRLARSKQRNKLVHGNEESVGITLGGQVNRLLKSQLGRLILPQTRLRQMQTILQKQALQKNKKARGTVSRGPVMVFTDGSGSMSGDRIMQAKGLCLAMAWLAKTQKRWFCGVEFSSRGEVLPLVLDPQRSWDANKLMEWCGHFFGGGTEPPMAQMADIYAKTQAPVGKTDLIFITDGDVCVSSTDEKKFMDWKKAAQTKVITLFIQSRANGSMARVSDEIFEVKNLDVSQDGIEACVSV